MIKHLLAGAVASVVLTGVAVAQVQVSPIVPPPGSNTTIRAGIAPDGTVHATATSNGVDENGQDVKINQSYQTGPDGTRVMQSQTQTDPDTGNSVTRSTTTTQDR